MSKPGSKTSRRQQMQARQRRRKMVTNLIWVGLGIAALAVVGFVVWRVVRPVDAEMAAILSIDATRANRIVKARGYAITGAVKDGYVLRPTTPMLDIFERVAGHAPVLVPLFTQDITPPGNGIHRINSIMQPATLTSAPVIGVALLSPVVNGGAFTGVTDEHDLAMAGRFVIEVAKEYANGSLPFYFDDELRRLVELYGPLSRLVGR